MYEMQSREKSHKHMEECLQKVRKEKDELFAKMQEKNKESKSLSLQLEEYRLRVNNLEEELLEQEENSERNKARSEKIDILMKENNRLNSILQ